jgi:hypothetical protein
MACSNLLSDRSHKEQFAEPTWGMELDLVHSFPSKLYTMSTTQT